MLNEIKSEIRNISNRKLSWLGRINMVKMRILPKVLYKFQMLPIFVPSVYLETIKTMWRDYMWQGKKLGCRGRL